MESRLPNLGYFGWSFVIMIVPGALVLVAVVIAFIIRPTPPDRRPKIESKDAEQQE